MQNCKIIWRMQLMHFNPYIFQFFPRCLKIRIFHHRTISIIVIEFRNDHPVFWRHWNPLLNFYKGRKSPLLVLFSCFQITNLDLDFRTMLYEMGRDLIKKGLAPPKQIFSKDQLLLSITTKAQF